MKDKNDFYIGWMPEAPSSFAKHVRKCLVVLLVLVVSTGIILALQQRKFSTASFEFGQLTSVTGIYQSFPVPSIRVTGTGDRSCNKTVLTIPLTGYGKFGAEGIIGELEKENKMSFDNKMVTFKGTLLYSDGKTLLQIDKNDHPLLTIKQPSSPDTLHTITELGTVDLTGEVLDPKCYFGVMKPGQGKPHKDCAVRCISGGMSPVFFVRDEKGEANYYLLLDEEGKKMNERLKDIIAEPVSLRARAVQYDDWVILYVDKRRPINRTGELSWFKTKDGETWCGPAHSINVE